jgi:CubicO group peptidase (beta-lactamase class C family)
MNSIHDIMSCTKSIVSSTFGITKDKGFINSVQDMLFSFLVNYNHLQNPLNQDINLHHLLTMTAGFEWNQSPPFDNNNSLMQMTNADDSIGYILERKMVAVPGEQWNYNGGCTQLLAEVIYVTTGIKAKDFAHSQLFEPLGITQYEWRGMDDGRANADYGLHMRSRDLAKIGLLFLNKGIWQGKRILSESWIEESTKAHVKPYGDSHQTGYGYQWWVNPFYGPGCHVEHYSALGNGGQCIIVFPTLDMVVVFTQHYYNRNDDAFSMVNNYIIPAIL